MIYHEVSNAVCELSAEERARLRRELDLLEQQSEGMPPDGLTADQWKHIKDTADKTDSGEMMTYPACEVIANDAKEIR